MLFTLEALEAKHGDCLILHYGDPNKPKAILVDGGPRGVYAKRLAPRLQQLSQTRSDGRPCELRLIVISHVDDDHIRGILDLTQEMLDAEENNAPKPADVLGLWHNSFEDQVTRASAIATEVRSTVILASTDGPLPGHITKRLGADTRLLLASIPQGRKLAADARRLRIKQNGGFEGGLIVAPRGGTLSKRLEPDLEITVVCPRQEQLDALQNDWANWVKEQRKSGKLKPAEAMEAAAAAFLDRSVYNLSSIVLLVRSGNCSMLLTGDARGDYVLEALHESGLKQPGEPFEIDLLKVPHHGSWRNLADEFFAEVVAKHYVISANGQHDNPDEEAVRSLLRSRPKGRYAVYLTNRLHFKTGEVLRAAKLLEEKGQSNIVVDYRDPGKKVPGVVVNLGRSKLKR